MAKYSNAVVSTLRPKQRYLVQRKALVDWVSGTGDVLHISNQAIHHAILLLDLFATFEQNRFDV
jgi:hypothetical protein